MRPKTRSLPCRDWLARGFRSLCCAVALCAQAASASELVFMTHELKPLTWKDPQTGQLRGFAYDLCRETIVRMGHSDPAFQVIPFARLLKAVEEKDNTVAFHVAKNEERAPLMKWVGPIITGGVYFYLNASSTFTANTLDDMRQLKTIGVGRGNASEALLKTAGFTNLWDVTNEEQALKMLETNRIEAVPVGELVVDDLARQGMIDIKKLRKTGIMLTQSTLYMGFSKNISDGEIEKWQHTFDQVKREKLDMLYRQYLSQPAPTNTP